MLGCFPTLYVKITASCAFLEILSPMVIARVGSLNSKLEVLKVSGIELPMAGLLR